MIGRPKWKVVLLPSVVEKSDRAVMRRHNRPRDAQPEADPLPSPASTTNPTA
jgi:hypothetical protein